MNQISINSANAQENLNVTNDSIKNIKKSLLTNSNINRNPFSINEMISSSLTNPGLPTIKEITIEHQLKEEITKEEITKEEITKEEHLKDEINKEENGKEKNCKEVKLKDKNIESNRK